MHSHLNSLTLARWSRALFPVSMRAWAGWCDQLRQRLCAYAFPLAYLDAHIITGSG